MITPYQITKEALQCLGGKFDTRIAMQMLLAIGYQESGFVHRKQVKGPAVGFWQFEKGGGIFGVITHRASKGLALLLFDEFKLGNSKKLARSIVMDKLYTAFQKEEFDVLAACYARLLLWTHPKALPTDKEEAWDYYLAVWRPGKPHRNRWDENWKKAIEQIEENAA